MPLKGEAKKRYQREYIRRRREAVRPTPLERMLDPALIEMLDNVQHDEMLDPDPIDEIDVRPDETADFLEGALPPIVGVLAGVRPDSEGYYPAWAITSWVKFNGKVRQQPLPNSPDGRYH